MSVWWSCTIYSYFLSIKKSCHITNSIERAAKLTLPYLSAHVLGMASCNGEGKGNGNWNGSRKQNKPSQFTFTEQVISKLPKMLYKCLLIIWPLQQLCEMDIYYHLHHFIHAESWADLLQLIQQPSSTGEMRTQSTWVSISMLTSFVPNFMMQP